jgi:hypothetical protein
LEVLCRISFFYCLPELALAFPKLMGMLIDSVKIKAILMLIIALMLIGILLCNPFFLFRLSLFIDFTEHTLANLDIPYIVTW